MIPLHKAFITGKERKYIHQVISNGNLSGNGEFTEKCQNFFEKKYQFKKTYLTSSCTDALEMCALLLNINPGDEIILPSYTFVSTANAFEIHGAKLIFCDSENDTPNIDAEKIERLITPNTKAIVVVHYAGIACDMVKINELAKKYNLYIIEDAALALDSYLKDIPLGKWGDLGTFSFHETKNITCGEGGLLVINNSKFLEKAELIWEKGTNRSAFLRGEKEQYEWVNKGSSFLPSEITAAFLYAQIEEMEQIQQKRISIWNNYLEFFNLLDSDLLSTPQFHPNNRINASMFYLILSNKEMATSFTEYMHKNNIMVASHYRPLHLSVYFKNQYKGEKLVNCEKYNSTLIRLPLFTELNDELFSSVTTTIQNYFK